NLTSATLNFDVHNFLNDQGAKHLHPQSEQAHLDAGRVRPKHFHIVRLNVEHDQEQNKGQGDQNDAAQSPFRCQGLDLSQNSVAFADDVADLVENLRQVAARLFLNGHRRHEETQVEVGNAVAHTAQGVFQG